MWLENVLVENERMSKLVDDLLTLSRADTQEPSLTRSVLAFDQMIQKVVDSFIPLVDQSSISLHTKLDQQIMMMGDPDRLKQLIAILLDNAIKYTEAGGSVTLTLTAHEKHLLFTISDTGIGIKKRTSAISLSAFTAQIKPGPEYKVAQC